MKTSIFRSVCRFFGYELIKSKKNPSLDSHLRNIFKNSKIDTVIDVGANRGDFAKKLRLLGFKGQILSFEPVTEVYEQLAKQSLGDKNWQVFNFGFGEFKEDVLINKSVGSDLSSILKPNEVGQALFNQKLIVEYSQKITLQTLDDFYNQSKLAGNVFLKTDTQGFDLNVLKGGKNCLPHLKFVLVETAFIPIYNDVPTFHQLCEFLDTFGFKLSGIYPVSKNKLGQFVEADSLFVK